MGHLSMSNVFAGGIGDGITDSTNTSS